MNMKKTNQAALTLIVLAIVAPQALAASRIEVLKSGTTYREYAPHRPRAYRAGPIDVDKKNLKIVLTQDERVLGFGMPGEAYLDHDPYAGGPVSMTFQCESEAAQSCISYDVFPNRGFSPETQYLRMSVLSNGNFTLSGCRSDGKCSGVEWVENDIPLGWQGFDAKPRSIAGSAVSTEDIKTVPHATIAMKQNTSETMTTVTPAK